MYRGWTQTDYQNKHYNIIQKWLQHVQSMDTNRLPKQALQYKPEVATMCTENGYRLPKQALQYKPKVATTRTEDGHKQTTKTSTTI